MSIAWYWPDWNPANCFDQPAASCADAGCPVHGDSDDAWFAADERDDE